MGRRLKQGGRLGLFSPSPGRERIVWGALNGVRPMVQGQRQPGILRRLHVPGTDRLKTAHMHMQAPGHDWQMDTQ